MPNDAAPWAQGYVSDILYTNHFFREFAPVHINHVAVIRDCEARPLTPGFTYCELGCGQGQTINILAAANPQGQFYACDFNPSHVAAARRLAQAGKLTNLSVLERNFEEMGDESLPDFDFIVLHGVWSWVSAENRRHITEFIYRRLKPGGLAYVSYNTLPGWASLAPLRQLLIAGAAGAAGDSGAKAKAGLAFVKQLRDAKAQYFGANPAAGPFVDRITGLAPNYLAHEYLNRDWDSFYSSDVARTLAAAKLQLVGSATLVENHRGLIMPKPMADVLAAQTSREMAELTQDFLVNQKFRRDVFARGQIGLNAAAAQRQLASLTFGLVRPAADVVYKGKGALAEFSFDNAQARAAVGALAAGPRTLEQIARVPGLAGLPWPQIVQVITLLSCTGQVAAFARTGESAPATIDPGKLRVPLAINQAILSASLEDSSLTTLASTLFGSGIGCDVIDRLFLRAHAIERAGDPVGAVWAVFERRGIKLKQADKPIEGRDENVAELRRRYDVFKEKTLPFLVSAGIVETA